MTTTAGIDRVGAPVCVGVLGPLVVERAGRPLPVPGTRLRALLSAPAAMVERRVTPDELAEALWPTGPPPGAGRTVRSHIARLRRLLGAAAIATESGGYRLSLAHVDLDADDLARSRSSLRSGDVDELAPLRRTMRSWRGSPFPELVDWLPGVVASRALTEDYIAVCEHVLAVEIGAGHGGDAIADLERLVAEFALRESLWVLLARARCATGDHVGALRACHAARTVLADIAGIGPGRDLVEIERTALTGSPESAGSRPEGERTDVAIGRDADVAAVLDACATADVVIVAGESGIGKTTLLDALATRLRARGAVVGRGSSGVAASGAFPALQGVLHDLGVTSWDTSGDRVAQATAFARALLEAAGGAVTLLLDDAHWLTEDELHIVADEFSNFEVNY